MHLIDVFPNAPKVNRLLVVEPDTEVQPLDFWVWMRSLQGIVNRTDPHLYYVRDFQKSAQRKNRLNKEYHWVEYYEKTFGIPHEALGDIDELIERSLIIEEKGLVGFSDEEGIEIEEAFKTLLTGLAVRYYKSVTG